ncbi:MAG TPA: RNA-directed DNA polymerase [Bryobacteraceae bacterium]|nr:RNA-directed DNA polymerase [Bryobacteraceae bacterium]
MPKSSTGFRASLQPDPIDSLVYAAAIYEAAETLEKYRVPANLGVACSFRFELAADGSLFEPQAGWPTYHARSVALANSNRFTHVITTDISDFYNQVSHHRVNNILEAAGISAQRARNIENFLSNLTATQSRGLPVGPSASIVLAEASLDDVDKFLMSRGLAYTRYVDDFRIFTPSERDAIEAVHSLWEYLHTAHRLVLTPSKTKLYVVDQFIQRELVDPAEQEERGKVAKLKSLIEEVFANSGYAIGFEDLPDSEQNQATRENLLELFEAAIGARPIHLGLIRYLLRRAKQLRTTALQKPILANLRRLSPAMREVIEYLVSTIKSRNAEVAEAMIAHLNNSPVGRLPFVRLWGLELFARVPFKDTYPTISTIAEESRNSLGIRPLALLAQAYGNVSWIRGQKEKWANHSPWDRRAVIWASRILPGDERRHWCNLVKRTSQDSLDRVVADWTATI